MRELVQTFQAGGSMMYLILFLLAVALSVVIIGAVMGAFTQRERGLGFGFALLGIAGAMAAAGWWGYHHGMDRAHAAIAAVDPSMAGRLLAQAELEAAPIFSFGLYGGIAVGLAGAAMLGLATRAERD